MTLSPTRFISELPPNGPEMQQHVFGENFKRDAKGNPIENGRGSDESFAANRFPDSIRAHLDGVYRTEGAEAADQEYERIRGLQRAAGTSPLIDWKRPPGPAGNWAIR